MKFTHLTFDCYGTLVDWRKGIETNLGELLRKNGLPSGVSVFPLYVKLEAELSKNLGLLTTLPQYGYTTKFHF